MSERVIVERFVRSFAPKIAENADFASDAGALAALSSMIGASDVADAYRRAAASACESFARGRSEQAIWSLVDLAPFLLKGEPPTTESAVPPSPAPDPIDEAIAAWAKRVCPSSGGDLARVVDLAESEKARFTARVMQIMLTTGDRKNIPVILSEFDGRSADR